MNQLVWVVYDVTSDRMRAKISKLCKKLGLMRVQKSVFLGKLPKSRMDELVLASEKLIDAQTDSVYVFPLCEADFGKVKLLGLAFDRRMVTDQVKAMLI